MVKHHAIIFLSMTENQSTSPFEKIMKGFHLVMSLLYIIIGSLLFAGVLNLGWDKWQSQMLGILVMAFGAFRFYRVYSKRGQK